jgi:hypothetical protein
MGLIGLIFLLLVIAGFTPHPITLCLAVVGLLVGAMRLLTWALSGGRKGNEEDF